jgi:hypothetical protein
MSQVIAKSLPQWHESLEILHNEEDVPVTSTGPGNNENLRVIPSAGPNNILEIESRASRRKRSAKYTDS